MSKIELVVIFETKPESTHVFAKLIKLASQQLPNIQGCLHATAKVCEHNPNQFLILEHWESKEAHVTHLNHLINSGAWEELAQHLSTDPVSHYYRDLE